MREPDSRSTEIKNTDKQDVKRPEVVKSSEVQLELSSHSRPYPISIASIFLLLFIIPVANQLNGFYMGERRDMVHFIPDWLRWILFFPSTKLVGNPITRISVSIATGSILLLLVFDLLSQRDC
jgi:hypothetical protein